MYILCKEFLNLVFFRRLEVALAIWSRTIFISSLQSKTCLFGVYVETRKHKPFLEVIPHSSYVLPKWQPEWG